MSQYETVLEELRTIRDERGTHANTANRVGTALIDMLSLIENQDLTNLNADLLDGFHADHFATAAALTSLAGVVGGLGADVTRIDSTSPTAWRSRLNG